ncbi:hypothetical protein APHAL10511_003281 [Amanita phalloides]|nr:hypothetical protein APHAL10511_003281 [Amanita phalloides]
MNTSLRRLLKISKVLSLAPPKTSGVRRYSYAALKTRHEADGRTTSRQASRRQKNLTEEDDDFDSRGMAALGPSAASSRATVSEGLTETGTGTDQRRGAGQNSDAYLVEHINGLFPPLQFPPDLARRILTHGSHPSAIHGHNAGLRFIGRRVIESYLLLFLNSSSALKPMHDLDVILDRTVNTYLLGEHVGSSWGLGRALRWTPAVPTSQLPSTPPNRKELLRGVGLYKVQGDTVAAVVGGTYYQFGASVAQRLFHTRVLPKLLLERRPEGLPDVFHAEALAMCERMGGPDAQLSDSSSQRVEAVPN